MNTQELQATITDLVIKGKGILAADEKRAHYCQTLQSR